MATYREKFHRSDTWHEKVAIMELFHLTMESQSQSNQQKWTIAKTAKYFNVSLGLVSENLKLARAIHANKDLVNCASRQDALRKLKNGTHVEATTEGSPTTLDRHDSNGSV